MDIFELMGRLQSHDPILRNRTKRMRGTSYDV